MAEDYKDLAHQYNFQMASFGAFGCRNLTDGQSGEAGEIFHVLEAKADTTFTTLTNAPYSANGQLDWSSYTLSAGEKLYGLFTEVDVNIGDIKAYLITTES